MFLTLGFFASTNTVWAASEFRVVASIKPVHSILAGLMEGVEPPELLLSGDRAPFDHVPNREQIESLRAARMVVWVGPELEEFLIEPIADLGPEVHVVTLLDNPALKILPSRWNEAARDPYFWLDSRNGVIMVDELTRALIVVDPARSHLYKRNRTKVHERMARLDRKLEYGYQGLKNGQALTYYDTQQYFEQAYALKIGESLAAAPDSPIAAAELLDGRMKLASGDYACLLIEIPFKISNLELLVGDTDIPIGRLDSLGASFDAGSDLYFQLMEHNTGAIKSCFRRGDGEETVMPGIQDASTPGEIGGRFLLVDHNGELFTDKDMKGRYQLIFFGYISCPDICPTSLLTGSRALEIIGEKSERIQPYFISVDPERDTPDMVSRYLRYFSEDLIGLTGTEAMIERVARHYNVKYEKVYEADGDLSSYAVDHTSSFFLMAPNGSFVTKFAYGITPEQLAGELQKYVQ